MLNVPSAHVVTNHAVTALTVIVQEVTDPLVISRAAILPPEANQEERAEAKAAIVRSSRVVTDLSVLVMVATAVIAISNPVVTVRSVPVMAKPPPASADPLVTSPVVTLRPEVKAEAKAVIVRSSRAGTSPSAPETVATAATGILNPVATDPSAHAMVTRPLVNANPMVTNRAVIMHPEVRGAVAAVTVPSNHVAISRAGSGLVHVRKAAPVVDAPSAIVREGIVPAVIVLMRRAVPVNPATDHARCRRTI